MRSITGALIDDMWVWGGGEVALVVVVYLEPTRARGDSVSQTDPSLFFFFC